MINLIIRVTILVVLVCFWFWLRRNQLGLCCPSFYSWSGPKHFQGGKRYFENASSVPDYSFPAIDHLKKMLRERSITFEQQEDGILIKGDADFDIEILDAAEELIFRADDCYFRCDEQSVLDLIEHAITGNLRVVDKLRGGTVVRSALQVRRDADFQTEGCAWSLDRPLSQKRSTQTKHFVRT